MGGWGCPHEINGQCDHVPGKACDPGMKGCVLHGKVTFSIEAKNSPRIKRQQEEQERRRKQKM